MIDISKYESLKDVVKEDETVLWVGRPNNFALTDGGMKTPLLLRWLLSAVIGIACLAAYIAKFGGSEVFQPLIIVVIVAVFGFLIVRPFMDKATLAKKVVYCITDKRVVMTVGHRDGYDLAKAGLKVKFLDSGNGNVHVAMGSCSELEGKKLRAKSLSPKRGDGDMITGFVMYNVDKCVEDFFVS